MTEDQTRQRAGRPGWLPDMGMLVAALVNVSTSMTMLAWLGPDKHQTYHESRYPRMASDQGYRMGHGSCIVERNTVNLRSRRFRRDRFGRLPWHVTAELSSFGQRFSGLEKSRMLDPSCPDVVHSYTLCGGQSHPTPALLPLPTVPVICISLGGYRA